MSLLLLGGCGPATTAAPENDFVLISQPSFVKVWDVQLAMHPGDSIKGIYYLDGTVHVTTDMSFDHAVKGDSGQLLFRNQIGKSEDALLQMQWAPTLVTGGIAFATTHTLEMYSRTGGFIRSVDVVYNITNQPVGNKNYVYLGMDFKQGCLGQVDVTKDFEPVQWSFLTFGAVDGPAAYFNGVVFCGSEDGNVRACQEDSTPYWTTLNNDAFDTQSRIVSGIAVDGSTCYCSTLSGKLYAIDKDTGKLKWQYLTGIPLEATPQVSDSGVYQYVPDIGLVALNKTEKLMVNGVQMAEDQPFHKPRWIFKYGASVLSEDDQYLYVNVGTPDHYRGLAAVDKQTGHVAFWSHRRDFVAVASQPKGELMYGVTRSGVVVAFKPVFEPGSYGEIAMNSLSSAPNTLSPAPGIPLSPSLCTQGEGGGGGSSAAPSRTTIAASTPNGLSPNVR
jgi:outer membrane protein assembly factor BamB